MRRCGFLFCCIYLLGILPSGQAQRTAPLRTPALAPIRGAHYPALSPDGRQLCFSYLGDLWVVSSEGGMASRLTVHVAHDAYPRWSPDGNWIAFSSNRDGNYDVFIIPAQGGEARPLTFHSADDIVMDWSPDGSQILFGASREGQFVDLYAIALKDGKLRRLTNDRTSSTYGAFSPGGKQVAYVRGGQSWWRPKYKGSRNAEIYTLELFSGKTRRLTRYEGWDGWPLYASDGRTLYFVTDRDGTSNVWRMSVAGGDPQPITRHQGDAVRFPSIARDGSRIAYEYNAEIWILPLKNASGQSVRTAANIPRARAIPLKILAPSDQRQNVIQPTLIEAGATSLALSEDGKTFAFTARGEIWTCPVDGGDATRLTETGAAEYQPVWSPDGNRLAYTTDRNGNLDVYLMDVKTKAEQPLATNPADDTRPQFSPDGRFLAYIRTGGSEPGLYVQPLPPGKEAPTPEVVRVGPGTGIGGYAWSPDARWLVYQQRDPTGTTDLWIVPTVGGTPVNITRYPGFNGNPQWSRDGKQIVFTALRGSTASTRTMGLYRLELMPPPPRDDDAPVVPALPSPPRVPGPAIGPRGRDNVPPSSDVAEGKPEFQRRRPVPSGSGGPPSPPPGFPSAPVPPRATHVRINFDDIHLRARQVTMLREFVSLIVLSPDSRTVIFPMTADGQAGWWAVDIQTGNMQRIAGGPTGGSMEFGPDGTKFYFLAEGGLLYEQRRGAPAPTRISYRGMMRVDRRAELKEAFNEAWRHLRTQFYDPKMHGVDWSAMRAKYEPLLDEIATKEDFAWLLRAMVGELNASHLGATPPSDPGPQLETGELGLRFDPHYAGPGLKVVDVLPKGPADQPGRHVAVGEYVLAMDGEEVVFSERLYKLLNDKVDRTVELLVGSKPTKEGAWTVKLKPISRTAARDLEYERWVASRRRKVAELSSGQLAYIHIRAMNRSSLERFEREIFGDAQSKRGLVLDVRFNNGGRIHDELLGILSRRPHAIEVPRDAEPSPQPFQLWNKPTVLLINEYSASDAEIFPNGFRVYGLGKIVGVQTAGGVIGTSNIRLIDGTVFRVPRTGWYTMDGQMLENTGVQPDVTVEHTPEDNAVDNDRQLEAAVRLLLAEIAQSASGKSETPSE